MKKHAIWIVVVMAVITVMGAYDLFARSSTFNPTKFTDLQTTGDFVSNGAAVARNYSTTGSLYGNMAGTVTGSASLNLLLTGGTMTGPIKQRAAMGADAFKNVSSSGFYGPLTGNVTGTASLDLPLAGGTMTGAIKQRTAQPANALKNVSTTRVYGPVTGDVVGNVLGNISGDIEAKTLIYTGHSFTTMTTTINGILRNILYY